VCCLLHHLVLALFYTPLPRFGRRGLLGSTSCQHQLAPRVFSFPLGDCGLFLPSMKSVVQKKKDLPLHLIPQPCLKGGPELRLTKPVISPVFYPCPLRGERITILRRQHPLSFQFSLPAFSSFFPVEFTVEDRHHFSKNITRVSRFRFLLIRSFCPPHGFHYGIPVCITKGEWFSGLSCRREPL